MKKVVSIICMVIVLLSVSSCSADKKTNATSAKDAKATIVDNAGNTVTMTYSELYKECQNDAKFEKTYRGAEITFIGTVSSIDTNIRYEGTSLREDRINFKEGYTLYLNAGEFTSLLETLSVDSKVQVKSNICSNFGKIEIRGCSRSGAYGKDSMSKTKLTIVH